MPSRSTSPQLSRFSLGGKPLRLFVDSGYMGPGPVYSTMDAFRKICGEDAIPEILYVLDYYTRETIPEFNSPAARHFKNYIARYSSRPYRFHTADYLESLYTCKEPGVWLTGFTFCTPDDFVNEYRGLPIPIGTTILACNSVFGTPSFFMIKLAHDHWHQQTIHKTLPTTLPLHTPTPTPTKRLILNNPFNWHGPEKPYSLIKSILMKMPLEQLETILIVCADGIQTSELKQLEPQFHALNPMLKDKLHILGPTEIRLKDNLKPDDLVIAEGVGLLEDCLRAGALGIQIRNPNTEKIITVYDHLISDAIDREHLELLHALNDIRTNFSAVLETCFNPIYRTAFFNYREKLIKAPGENTLEVLIESYENYTKDQKKAELDREHTMTTRHVFFTPKASMCFFPPARRANESGIPRIGVPSFTTPFGRLW